MARYKRYFPVNHDINLDPEFNRLCEAFGLPGVRFWLQLLAMLDKTENKYNAGRELDLGLFSRLCATKPKFILGCYRLLIDMKWITSAVDVNNNLIISAPNYLKYHRTRGTQSESNGVPPNLPFPSLTFPKENSLKKESKRKVRVTKKLCSWPKDFELTERLYDYALDQSIEDPTQEFENFRIKAQSKGYKYLDWDLAWMSWCRSPYQKQKPSEATFYDPEGVL